MQEYATEYWRIHLPEQWQWEEDIDEAEDAVGFFDPAGDSMLAVSCSVKDDGFVELADLEDFAAELLAADLEPVRTSIGHLHGLLFEHADGDEWWREWFLACDDLFFYITYNCPLPERGREDDTIRTILHRLEVIA